MLPPPSKVGLNGLRALDPSMLSSFSAPLSVAASSTRLQAGNMMATATPNPGTLPTAPPGDSLTPAAPPAENGNGKWVALTVATTLLVLGALVWVTSEDR